MPEYRSLIRGIILDILGKFSMPQNGVHILNGHFIASHEAPQDIFFKLLEGLSKITRLIDIQDASELVRTGKTNVTEKLVAFTFDDGFEECFTKIKPVLDHFGIKAAFFINPNFVDGDKAYIKNYLENVVYLDGYKLPMGWDKLAVLKNQGHIIGAHTMDHLRLNIQDEQMLQYQIENCKQVIEKKLNGTCDYFAYPYGRLADISKEAVNMAYHLYKYNYTQSNHKQYLSFNGRFINRRHFEGNWPLAHVNYFLKKAPESEQQRQ